MSTPAAGWFPDPAGRPDSYRWWDGAAWTRYLTDDAASPAPAPEPQSSEPQPAEPPPPEQAPVATDPQAPSEGGDAAVGSAFMTARRRPMPPGYDFARPDNAAGRPRQRLIVSILAALVVGTVATAIAVNTHTEATSLLQPPPPVSSTAAPKLTADYEDATRVLTAPPLTVTMPGAPFTTTESEFAGFGLFEDGAESQVVVQNDYDGKGGKWIGVVAAGVYGPTVSGKDLESTASKVFDGIVDAGFSDVKATIKKPTSEAAAGYPDKAWIANGEVHYKKKGITSTYDAVSVLVVDAGDGNYVGWISDRPNKAAPSVKAAVSASVKTIKIT